jgi:crotonobetainyl-CoA:carnitine CoA-transferase CaiB-like acyl-CoA transferase
LTQIADSSGTAPTTPATGPLTGVLVADFSRVLAGPYCTMLLADLGADVIKVESPAGDDTRHWVPPLRNDMGTYYLALNRNKRSVVLDLDNAADLALAHELAVRADVTIENFKPGGLARFQLDYESVSRRNPRSIYCSISGFGSFAGASLPGYDLLVQGASGLMDLTGAPDGPPYRAGIPLFDVLTGLYSAIGILAALHHRDISGTGQRIETNLLSCALSALVNQSSAYVAGGIVPQRMGNSHPTLFPYEPLPTADGELIVIAGNDAQFARLAEALQLPELAADAHYATVAARSANRTRLRQLLVTRLASRTAAEWFDILGKAGVACGPINDVAGGIALATELGLDPVVLAGDIPTIRNPIALSRTPANYDLAPPLLDEHGDEIRSWLADSA